MSISAITESSIDIGKEGREAVHERDMGKNSPGLDLTLYSAVENLFFNKCFGAIKLVTIEGVVMSEFLS
jgi:hypothetical protein